MLTYGLTFTADNIRHIICDFQVLVLPILHLQTFTQAYMKTHINNEDIKTWANTIHSTSGMKICKFYTSPCKSTPFFTLTGA